MSRIGSGLLSATEFDRETFLDVTVNLVPMGILAFLVGTALVFGVVFNVYPYDPFASVITYGLMILPIVFLSILTYVSAEVLSGGDDAPSDPTPSDADLHGGARSTEAVRGDSASNDPESPDVGADRSPVADESDGGTR